MEPVEGEPWPVRRIFHAACCLGYGEDHPQLLVHGGQDTNKSMLGDMWVLDIDTGKWTEVSVSQFFYSFGCSHHSLYFHSMQVTPPEAMKPRCGHSTTATSLGPGLTEVLMFGGRRTNGGANIAETTILRFGE